MFAIKDGVSTSIRLDGLYIPHFTNKIYFIIYSSEIYKSIYVIVKNKINLETNILVINKRIL